MSAHQGREQQPLLARPLAVINDVCVPAIVFEDVRQAPDTGNTQLQPQEVLASASLVRSSDDAHLAVTIATPQASTTGDTIAFEDVEELVCVIGTDSADIRRIADEFGQGIEERVDGDAESAVPNAAAVNACTLLAAVYVDGDLIGRSQQVLSMRAEPR